MAMAFVKYGNFTIMYESVSKSDYATIRPYVCLCMWCSSNIMVSKYYNWYIFINVYIYIKRWSRHIKTYLLIVFISIFQSTVDTAAQFLQDGRHKTTAKGKSSNRNSELTEKSRELTESLKQLQQSYSSSNIQVSYVKCFW